MFVINVFMWSSVFIWYYLCYAWQCSCLINTIKQILSFRPPIQSSGLCILIKLIRPSLCLDMRRVRFDEPQVVITIRTSSVGSPAASAMCWRGWRSHHWPFLSDSTSDTEADTVPHWLLVNHRCSQLLRLFRFRRDECKGVHGCDEDFSSLFFLLHFHIST